MAEHLGLRWTSMFADVPAGAFGRALTFWEQVTGASAGDPAGDQDEFVPLVPRDGDRYLWLQRVGRDSGGWHLDLHVTDLQAAVRWAKGRGARIRGESADLVTLESPGGQPFCLVPESSAARHRPAPADWAGAHRSMLDQLCMDIPADRFDAECAFWSELTGWSRDPGDLAEFVRLQVPPRFPLRILLQRLGGDDAGGIRAHADLSADERAPEVVRHAALGGQVVRVAEHWTTLRDPAGLLYCVTDRHPDAPAG
jgi:hypothetical protein